MSCDHLCRVPRSVLCACTYAFGASGHRVQCCTLSVLLRVCPHLPPLLLTAVRTVGPGHRYHWGGRHRRVGGAGETVGFGGRSERERERQRERDRERETERERERERER